MRKNINWNQKKEQLLDKEPATDPGYQRDGGQLLANKRHGGYLLDKEPKEEKRMKRTLLVTMNLATWRRCRKAGDHPEAV